MKSRRVLVADENSIVRMQLSKFLIDLGHQVRATSSPTTVLRWIEREEADLAILEAAGDGWFDLVREIRNARPELPVLLTSGRATLGMTVQSVRAGAVELLSKPLQARALAAAIDRAFPCPRDLDAARAQARAIRDERLPMIGGSEPIQKVYRTLARLADSALPLLIWGENGVGKTTAAKALHDLGSRREGPFVRLDPSRASIGPLERELLGEDGRSGKLAAAQGGTLLLENVDDLSEATQAELLHVLEQLAEGRPAADVRLVSTARRDLRKAVDEGRFRGDVFFRLATAAVRIPPLRERPSDIPDLARALLVRAGREGLPARQIDAAAVRRLQTLPWAGNVRELDNMMRRLCVFHADELINLPAVERELADLDVAGEEETPGPSLSDLVEQRLSSFLARQPSDARPTRLYEEVLETVERPLLQAVLSAAQGNQSQAAEMLGINRNTLRRKVQDLGLTPEAAAPGARAYLT